MSDYLVAALIEQILEQSFVLDTDIGAFWLSMCGSLLIKK